MFSEIKIGGGGIFSKWDIWIFDLGYVCTPFFTFSLKYLFQGFKRFFSEGVPSWWLIKLRTIEKKVPEFWSYWIFRKWDGLFSLCVAQISQNIKKWNCEFFEKVFLKLRRNLKSENFWNLTFDLGTQFRNNQKSIERYWKFTLMKLWRDLYTSYISDTNFMISDIHWILKRSQKTWFICGYISQFCHSQFIQLKDFIFWNCLTFRCIVHSKNVVNYFLSHIQYQSSNTSQRSHKTCFISISQFLPNQCQLDNTFSEWFDTSSQIFLWIWSCIPLTIYTSFF